jgi:hypothetical protein
VVHPETTRLIGQLGLRYPPAAGKDQEGHAGLLLLLAQDLADMPVSLLDAAIKDWVRSSQFMPKASELRNRAQTLAHAKGAAARARQALPAPAEERRPSKPYSAAELQAVVDGGPGSIMRRIFEMGTGAGWIEDLGGGRYREAGGTIIVTRSAPGGEPCPA